MAETFDSISLFFHGSSANGSKLHIPKEEVELWKLPIPKDEKYSEATNFIMHTTDLCENEWRPVPFCYFHGTQQLVRYVVLLRGRAPSCVLLGPYIHVLPVYL